MFLALIRGRVLRQLDPVTRYSLNFTSILLCLASLLRPRGSFREFSFLRINFLLQRFTRCGFRLALLRVSLLVRILDFLITFFRPVCSGSRFNRRTGSWLDVNTKDLLALLPLRFDELL